jgi:pyruvate/2-oxoglutarate dehydrogenase complex dihydrolipoamide acyltransferase (E2) component
VEVEVVMEVEEVVMVVMKEEEKELKELVEAKEEAEVRSVHEVPLLHLHRHRLLQGASSSRLAACHPAAASIATASTATTSTAATTTATAAATTTATAAATTAATRRRVLVGGEEREQRLACLAARPAGRTWEAHDCTARLSPGRRQAGRWGGIVRQGGRRVRPSGATGGARGGGGCAAALRAARAASASCR